MYMCVKPLCVCVCVCVSVCVYMCLCVCVCAACMRVCNYSYTLSTYITCKIYSIKIMFI